MNYDLSIDNIIKYKKIKIEGLGKLIKKNNNIEIIENININNYDINLSLNKIYIKSLKDIRSIYCEKEIQNFISIIQNKNIIDHSELKNLKYISLSIRNNLSNNYLSKLIKNAKKIIIFNFKIK